MAESVDFWTVHGWGFLIGITLFPRITMLVATAAGGGFFYWLGWLFVPRVVVAILAVAHYWHTNPVLCVIAVLLCVCGESAEKSVVSKRSD